MAAKSATQQIQELKSEIRRLKAENKELAAQATNKAHKVRPLPTLGSMLCVAVAAALLLVGNVMLWAGNTVVKTDNYVAATAPIIKDPVVQDALADNITQRLFQNVDVEAAATEALPPRAEFLAPAIADQVERHADETVKKILARPQFQERWNNAQARSHERFIRTVEAHGNDGSIDVSEVYTDVSQQLKGTKLAFLADKPLPARVGNITVAEGVWLTALQRTIQNIDTWRVVVILLVAVFSALAVWLSRNRRRTVITLGSFFAVIMLATLLAGRLMREIVASRVDPQYAEAVRHIYTTVAHGLVVQTSVILGVSLLMILVAWISGESASSRAVKSKIDLVLSGNVHAALFKNENGFTIWMGRHRVALQWLAVAVTACSALFTKLTPSALVWHVIGLLAVVGVIETLAAKNQRLPSSSTRTIV